MLPTNTTEILLSMGFTDKDFSVFHPDNGKIQLNWFSDKKQPTEAEILSQTDSVALRKAKERKLFILSDTTERKILQKYPLVTQINLTNGIRGTEEEKTIMVNNIKEILSNHDELQNKINNALTKAELDAIKI